MDGEICVVRIIVSEGNEVLEFLLNLCYFLLLLVEIFDGGLKVFNCP